MFKKWRASAETEMSLRAAQARMTANLVGNGNTNILHGWSWWQVCRHFSIPIVRWRRAILSKDRKKKVQYLKL
jgi:hypothetical protein